MLRAQEGIVTLGAIRRLAFDAVRLFCTSRLYASIADGYPARYTGLLR